MPPPAPSVAKRSRFRALRLLGWVLGTAGLAWGAVEVWRAQPAVQVSAPVKAAAAPEPVEEAAFRLLRGRLREPEAAAFEDVRVYSFGPPDERAVCGRVVGGARDTPAGGADFVVRVILPGSGRTGGSPLPVVEEGPSLARATANARRRYCRDANEPMTPLNPPVVAAGAAPDGQAGGDTRGEPALGGGGAPVALHRAMVVGGGTPVNLRSGPGGGAAVIATLPRGQVLDVFDRAPGGWLRVGVGEPWGWAHSSLLIEGP